MISYLVYSRDIFVYIRVWKTFPRLLYLDERCGESKTNQLSKNGAFRTKFPIKKPRLEKLN